MSCEGTFGGRLTLQGKGFFLSQLRLCENGDPAVIMDAALEAGLSHVVVQIADGEKAIGIDAAGIDFTAPVVQVLRLAGITVWGWHSVYGDHPSAEAAVAIARSQALDLDGYVVNVGKEYQNPRMTNAARQFMAEVRQVLKIPIALSSYHFPNYHPELPWSTLLEFCDLHMPKVSWESAHNAGSQLRESKSQCDALPNARPYIPTGAVYAASGWSPAAEDINDFLNTAQSLGLKAVNFYNWDACRQKLPLLWMTIASFAWPVQAPLPTQGRPDQILPDVFVARFLAALTSRQAAQVSAFYDPAATQVWADQIRTGVTSIQAGFAAFFHSLPSGTIFFITRAQAEDNRRLISWKAGQLTGQTTLVLKNGKIVLDYTFVE
jgi:hypothetical protein